MAANKTATKEEAQEAPATEGPDGAVLDLNDQSVKRMIKAAKKRGYVTFDELNEVLPSDSTSPEQIEQNVRAIGWKLDAAELAEIDRIAPVEARSDGTVRH